MYDQQSTASSDSYHQEASDTTGTAQQSDSASSKSSLSLAKKETKAVNASKLLVITCLLVAGVVIGGLTYYFLSSEQERDFESHFHDFAVEISEVVHIEARNVFLSVEGFSKTVTSFALDANLNWPYVTIPHFEVRGSHANAISNSLMTAFSPLVYQYNKDQWGAYSVKNQGWIQAGVDYNIKLHKDFINETDFEAEPISENIFRYEHDKQVDVEDYASPLLPVWQLAPAPHDDSIVNYNLLSNPVFERVYHGMTHTMKPVLSEVTQLDFLYGGSISDNVTHPHSFLLQPVYETFRVDNKEKDIVGFIISVLPWDRYFEHILPKNSHEILVVLKDTCNQTFTYMIKGQEAEYLGAGDLHDSLYEDMVFETDFATFVDHNVSLTKEHCEFFLSIYPTSVLENEFKTNRPAGYTLCVLLVFFITSLAFIMYDLLVQQRQDKVMETAKRSNALVSSLFPSNVRDRLMQDVMEEGEVEMKDRKRNRFVVPKTELKHFLNIESSEPCSESVFGTKPIADLFPNATVMFADIVGFTAWSSVREPTQVFQLLETIYHAFDNHGKRRRVFKVETIGDCYVAVCGLPEPRQDHALVMARFARDCLSTMNDQAKKLEVTLGPDTGDLSMRIGLNSGPVTAGVLRGEKARFQLFGDCVNTAARMESTGERNRIHISKDTADLLSSHGKSHWVSPREEKIFAKGKGELQTYWLDLKSQSSSSSKSGSTFSGKKHHNDGSVTCRPEQPSKVHEKAGTIKELNQSKDIAEKRIEEGKTNNVVRDPLLSDKVERLVDWNCDILSKLLKQIVVRRNASLGSTRNPRQERLLSNSAKSLTIETDEGATVLDEVKEIIELPRFDAKAARKQEEPNKTSLSPDVTTQLHDYVTVIATMYRDNPFHNFEHASHVTMSVVKLLSRIVAPDDVLMDDCSSDEDHIEKDLHCHTYGITSDPLTQFSVVFAALVHDVDHTGVPNAQLVKEQAGIATMYKNKSVAEQNSVDIAWDLLMDNTFDDLRAVIYSNQSELKRFRQLVVNTVMATDIVDKELKDLRNARWHKAFQPKELHEKDTYNDVNRKATIVIEHLIQASDVAHTMQHWHIYRKWNERFFQEMLRAYQSGRGETDPAEFWYKGEIGFFDFYIIPLAKKLKECGVFGVSSDEYLNYAMANRNEWESKGQTVVAEMVEKYRGKDFCYCEDQCMLGDEKKGR